jgi:hypothetical protein
MRLGQGCRIVRLPLLQLLVATVNAFTGDAGAEELTRAVHELKLRGAGAFRV